MLKIVEWSLQQEVENKLRNKKTNQRKCLANKASRIPNSSTEI